MRDAMATLFFAVPATLLFAGARWLGAAKAIGNSVAAISETLESDTKILFITEAKKRSFEFCMIMILCSLRLKCLIIENRLAR